MLGSVRVAHEPIISSSSVLSHEWTSEAMFKETVQLTEMYHDSFNQP